MTSFKNAAGMAILVADAFVVLEVFQSKRELPEKILWTLLVILCPVIGIIVYMLLSNREQKNFKIKI